MPESTNGRLERVKLHLADAKTREFYAIQRIDLLVISVSGAGIYIVFETIKFVLEKNLTVSRCLLEWSGGFFVTAILFNFASQWAGFYANKNEVCWAHLEHKKASGDKLTEAQEKDQCGHDTLGSIYGWWTRLLNIASTVAMIVGIIILLIFNLTSFEGV